MPTPAPRDDQRRSRQPGQLGRQTTMSMRRPQGLPRFKLVWTVTSVSVMQRRVASTKQQLPRARLGSLPSPHATIAGMEALVRRSGERGCPRVCGGQGSYLPALQRIGAGPPQMRLHAGHVDGRGPSPVPTRWCVGVSCGSGGTLGPAGGSERPCARDDESRGAPAVAWLGTPVHDSTL